VQVTAGEDIVSVELPSRAAKVLTIVGLSVGIPTLIVGLLGPRD
jgi:hypothetical protein